MKCKNCGKRFSKGDFCPSCGYNMKADTDKTGRKKKRKGYILIAVIVIFLLAIIGGVLCLFLSGKIPGSMKAPERLEYVNELVEVSEKLNEESAWEVLKAVSPELGITDFKTEYEYQGGSKREYFTVYRFDQYYDGMKVLNQSLKVVVDKEGELLFTSGNYAEIDENDIVFSCDSNAATDTAVEYLVNTYNCDADSVIIGDVSRVIFAADEQTDATTAAYEVCVEITGETVTSVYVDGGSGEVIGDYSTWSYDTYMTSQELEGQTGKQTVELTYDTDEGKYYFWDGKRNVGVFDFAGVDKNAYSGATYKDALVSGTVWDVFLPRKIYPSFFGFENEKNAVDALSNVQTTYDYYLETFHRNGIDGQNGLLYVGINYELAGNKAASGYYYGYDFIAIEDVTGITAANDLNIIAHEYTHGVINAEDAIISFSGKNLDDAYQKTEAQGINEGLADLFGEFAEAWADKKGKCDWQHGDRNIANPSGSNISSVDEYKSLETDCHDASTIVSHPAYLMATGTGNDEKIELETLENLYYNTILTMKCFTFEGFRYYLELSAVGMNDSQSKYGEVESENVLADEQLETVIDAMDTSGIESRLADYKATPGAELHIYDRHNSPYSDYTYTIRKGVNGEIIMEGEDANSSSFTLPDSVVPGYYWVTLTDKLDTTKTEVFRLLVNDNSDENKTSAYQDSIGIHTDFGALYLDVTVTGENETLIPLISVSVTASGDNKSYTAELTTDLSLDPVYRLIMPAGQYMIHVSASGYVAQEIQITLTEDDELEVILEKTKVFGTAVDSETGEALEDVKISIDGASWESNRDGYFSHHMDNAGTYIISFELEGYESVSVKAVALDTSDTDLGAVAMTPSSLQGVLEEIYASRVVKFMKGDPWTEKSDAQSSSAALGKPDYSNEKNALTLGGSGMLLVSFDEIFTDIDGADITIYEVGSDREPVEVAVSADCEAWYTVGMTTGGTSSIDMNGAVPEGLEFQYVRVIDLETAADGDWPGADIDAIGVNVLR